ncbi:hypothetical protein MN608_09556 [Microdochium nivale]|nr:hypothetical protein MN608_09556 [Microdochium nivale]
MPALTPVPTRPVSAYPAPLSGPEYAGLAPLPEDKAADGKSYVNPPANKLSTAYDAFAAPLDNGIRGVVSLCLEPLVIIDRDT